MTTKSSKVPLFHANEAASFSDLNDIVLSSSQRSWEWPIYGTLCEFARFFGAGADSLGDWYPATFGSPGQLRNVAFTSGIGLAMGVNASNLSIGRGFIGIYSGAEGPRDFDLTSPSTQMRWACISEPELVSITGIPSGSWGILRARISEVSTNTSVRHFRDSMTLALSSSVVPKRSACELSFSLLVVPGLPTYADLTAGGTDQALVALVHNDGGTLKPYDCTVPMRDIKHEVHLPRNLLLTDGTAADPVSGGGGWSPNPTGASASMELRFPGDPSMRLMRLAMRHNLVGTPTILIRGFNYTTGLYTTTPQLTCAVTLTGGGADFISDGTLRRLQFDFTAPPFGGKLPCWGHGRTIKSDWENGLALSIMVNNATNGQVTELHTWTV